MQKNKVISKVFSVLLAWILFATVGTSNVTIAAAYAAPAESSSPVSLSKTQPIYPTDNGDTLAEIIRALRGKEIEFACGFYQNGQKAFEVTSNMTTKVYTTHSMRTDFIKDGGTLFVHNHPSGSAFSGQDLKSAAENEFERTMIISDEYIYTLEPTDVGWGEPTAMKDYWTERHNYYVAYSDAFFETYRPSTKALLAIEEFPTDDSSLKWFCDYEVWKSVKEDPEQLVWIDIGLWNSHHTMLDVAEKFQMEYHRYVTDEFDATNPKVFLPHGAFTTKLGEEAMTNVAPPEPESREPNAALTSSIATRPFSALAWDFLVF